VVMIKRVARKMCKLDYPDQSDEWHDDASEGYCLTAEAIIFKMRDPTEAMVKAWLGAGHDTVTAQRDWNVMIDAALAPPRDS
jgi:hypothetical protein